MLQTLAAFFSAILGAIVASYFVDRAYERDKARHVEEMRRRGLDWLG